MATEAAEHKMDIEKAEQMREAREPEHRKGRRAGRKGKRRGRRGGKRY